LVLNLENCDFMVVDGVVLWDVVSAKGAEVDKTKVDIIQSLPYHQTIREVRSFEGHFEFYYRFIKDFSKVASPLRDLLAKDACFPFNEVSMMAFDVFHCFLVWYSKYIQVPIALRIRKRPHSLARSAHMLLDGCHLAYVMHQPHFKDAWWAFVFLALSPKWWKFSWMILLFMLILLMSACIISY